MKKPLCLPKIITIMIKIFELVDNIEENDVS
jgi:hypothetical protein